MRVRRFLKAGHPLFAVMASLSVLLMVGCGSSDESTGIANGSGSGGGGVVAGEQQGEKPTLEIPTVTTALPRIEFLEPANGQELASGRISSRA